MLKPARIFNVGQELLVVDGGEAELLDLPEGLPHHVDVLDLQEVKVQVLVVVRVLVAAAGDDVCLSQRVTFKFALFLVCIDLFSALIGSINCRFP